MKRAHVITEFAPLREDAPAIETGIPIPRYQRKGAGMGQPRKYTWAELLIAF
jgi:hypothetical protein